MLKRYDVHLYPIFRTKIRVEGEDLTPEQAEEQAVERAAEAIYGAALASEPGLNIAGLQSYFAEDYDTSLVDVLDPDDEDEITASVSVGPRRDFGVQAAATLEELAEADPTLAEKLQRIIEFLRGL